MKKTALIIILAVFAVIGLSAAGGQKNIASADNDPPAIIAVADQTVAAPEADARFKYLGWWGAINKVSAPVFAEPRDSSKKLGKFSKINRVKVLENVKAQSINGNDLWYKIDGGTYPGGYMFSDDVDATAQPEPEADPKIPSGAKADEYWIDVNLSKNILTLFIYDRPIFATYFSPGRIGNPTPAGIFRIKIKYTKIRMRGGPPIVPYYYNLPNVPYTMYYYKSYAIHGTYWHDKFGTRQSAGCTNLTQGDAKFIFDRVNPSLGAAAGLSVFASAGNPGTIIYNHY